MSRLDVLADPIRAAVARRLGRGAASATEVAQAVGVHLNTARAHLAALVDASVASRETQPTARRGRPVVRYRLAPGWIPAGDDLLGLAQLLATALAGGTPRTKDHARRWGRTVAGARPGSARKDVQAMLSRLGFEARVGADELTLTNCPCPLSSPERPTVVCDLVDAAIDGALEGGGLKVTGRRHHDPAARRCCMALAPA
jgi:predicted ArsR family transcriptional regulator